jgi:hypothetical protein
MLLYCLPVILMFPLSLITSAAGQMKISLSEETRDYLKEPLDRHQQALKATVPWVCETLFNLEVTPRPEITGSGDTMFDYCTCLTYLVFAATAAFLWTLASAALQGLKPGFTLDYDWLHSLFRLIVGFALMYWMFIYGGAKIFCSQFPPIRDAQLEVTYGDSSPMGLLWRFMQFSQPYTIVTGVVECLCGFLLICRRTTLLGALASMGACLQIFLLNMCYDVPVKLFSANLMMMALLLVAPDSKRLFTFFVLGRPTAPVQDVPLFGNWKWVNRIAYALRLVLFISFAALTIANAYVTAKSQGILAPERPANGRWIATGFNRAGKDVPLPKAADDSPPKKIVLSKWKEGTPLPAVTQLTVFPTFVILVLEDGSSARFFKGGQDDSEVVLSSFQDRKRVGSLRASFPETDVMVLNGSIDGEEIRMAFRRPRGQKEYLLKERGFNWIQEFPFNR